ESLKGEYLESVFPSGISQLIHQDGVLSRGV
ncbi:MAG: hypothetical protein JWP44_4411, partial [Mucilaginibacter sp.]|nr:hypothetical protein [Mucilaginibacter sp.]